MVRFAFNLNETARKILEEQESKGVTSRFGELFRPMSMEKDSSIKQLHRKVMHEKEVVDLFRAIGGSSDDPNIFPFLKYEKIENGQMCHHIVCVLPRDNNSLPTLYICNKRICDCGSTITV